ncbi:hypothetical protein BT96DRAFT_1004325 [Gymnopus androsaceus JB14]|uniref:Uncharacterized protein n=1 Tax=Gymnopus androsaceus JB14 TaxID=1447944 RepID=A0A6A4GSJ9_9AGAR|nr:hypothetical protein BT96DRAFT_1004325 [Gymnopus androsaceus JB14]
MGNHQYPFQTSALPFITFHDHPSHPSSRSHPPSLDELKRLKNRIIGMPSGKCRLAQDHGMMNVLIATMMDTGAGDDVRTEMAQILGSLAALGGHADDALSTEVGTGMCIEWDSGRFGRANWTIAMGLGLFEGTRWLAGSASQTLDWFFGTQTMMGSDAVRSRGMHYLEYDWDSGSKGDQVVANELALQEIVGHAKSRSGDIQLSACLCATKILRTSPAVSPAADTTLSVPMVIMNSAHSAKAPGCGSSQRPLAPY